MNRSANESEFGILCFIISYICVSDFMVFFRRLSYLLYVPSTGRVWHKAFLKVGPSAGPLPWYTQCLQKCFGPRRYFLKKRRQVMNLAPPIWVRARGTSPPPETQGEYQRQDTPDQICAYLTHSRLAEECHVHKKTALAKISICRTPH